MLEWRVFRGRSVGPTFSADFRKSLFGHLAFECKAATPVDDELGDRAALGEWTVFDGDSLFGAGGGRDLLLVDFCLIKLGIFADAGLFDLDLLLVLVVALLELPLDVDEAEAFDDTELSLDFEMLFSGLFSGDSELLFSSLDLAGDELLLLPLLDTLIRP